MWQHKLAMRCKRCQPEQETPTRERLVRHEAAVREPLQMPLANRSRTGDPALPQAGRSPGRSPCDRVEPTPDLAAWSEFLLPAPPGREQLSWLRTRTQLIHGPFW